MYRRLLYVIPALALSLLLAACTSCSSKKEDKGSGESPINPMVEELDRTLDEALLVDLVNYDADSIYVRTVSGQKSKAFAYAEAQSNGLFYGNIVKGNRYSILPTSRSNTVKIAVNTTELSGRWMYDQSQHRGFSFNEGGGMTSINAEDICFREWKLLNGKMYIYYVDMQQIASDRHQYLVEEACISQLTPTQLVIQFDGKDYVCSRPSNKPLIYHGN